ncbi:MAG: ribbon-helix-helix protein, CopG family [Oscillibacter sp.]|nr:ribbon-helix-helix protein, CopG family [Oscillibacter sp.]
MTISLRLNDADTMLIKKYAEMNGMSVSDLVRQSVLERIEDEFDLKAYETALVEYHANPVTYTMEDMEKELGLR